MKRYGKLEIDERASKKLGDILTKVNAELSEDPSPVEANPEMLREFGLDGEGIRTFRIVSELTGTGGCSCYCFPLITGTGGGCSKLGVGSLSSSHVE
jgi:hypothetical protein